MGHPQTDTAHVYAHVTAENAEADFVITLNKRKNQKNFLGTVARVEIGEFRATRVNPLSGEEISGKTFKCKKVLVNERELMREAMKWAVEGYDSVAPVEDAVAKTFLKEIMA